MNEYELLFDLKKRIDDKYNCAEVNSNDEIVSLFDLVNSLKNSLDKYNKVFVEELSSYKELLNKQIISENMNGKNIPLIDNIYPSSLAYVPNHIDFYFKNKNDEQYSGCVCFYSNLSYSSCLSNDYSSEDTIDFFTHNKDALNRYFDLLDEFNQEYPNINYEWNAYSDDKNLILDDGLLKIDLYLEKLNDVNFSFSFDNSKYNDLINYDKKYLMKRISINRNDINDLYKKLLNNKNDTVSLTLKK